MKRFTKISASLFLTTIFFAEGIAQDTLKILYYPSAKDFDEKIIAKVEGVGDSLKYSFTVTNSSNSRQAIYSIHFGISSAVRNIQVPSGWDGSVSEGIQRIPRVMCVSSDSVHNIHPGRTVTNFSYVSKGLPSITSYYAKAFVFPPVVDFEPDSIIGGGGLLDSRKINKTLGPANPPAPFAPLAFLDTLISYKHQAFDLGWIKNRGIVQSLDAKLDNAKRQLQRNNKTAAKNILQAFINEVEALWKEENQRRNPQGVQITSEAYALLKFNAEYLISKL